jgi:hypothetical protein
LVHRVFDDEVGRGGYRLFAKVGAPISDYNPAGGSSFFFGFSDYLNDMFHRKTRRLYSHNYCDDIGTRRHEGCAR